MNCKNNSRRLCCGLALGLLLDASMAAKADTLLTFQVDMSFATQAGLFFPDTQTMAARGSFNGWGNPPSAPFALTNDPAGANPYLYTGTTNIPGNGTVMQYKYTIEPGAQYEAVFLGGSHNRLVTLPAASGASLTLPKVYWADLALADVTVAVTFQVDMSQQINTGAFLPGSSSVQARGIFNGWGGTAVAQTNDPTILRTNQFGLVTSNVYVYTYEITGSPGQTMDYKYYIDTGSNWESPAPGTGDPNDNNNRFFNLGEATTQALPIVFFGDSPYTPAATNAVTFQVDMSAQVLKGAFDPASGSVQVRGDFTSWGDSPIGCTNDPAAVNTNLYTAVIPIADGIGATRQYKFWSSVSENSGWETMANNRTLKIVDGTAQTLPAVFFSNVNPGDLLPADTLVTFTVNMTNAVGTDSYTFNSETDGVYLNGLPPNGFLPWDVSLPALTNNPPGTKLYSIELVVPKGSPVQMTYKYSINGLDNEAASGNNHVRSIRTVGTYPLPLDTFGNQQVEPAFGQLSVGAPTGGYVPVSWLGRPGVHIQTTADLSSGSWQDLLNTDGAGWMNGFMSADGFVSVTNYPTAGDKTFLRLVKP